jgi:hypothetical protein
MVTKRRPKNYYFRATCNINNTGCKRKQHSIFSRYFRIWIPKHDVEGANRIRFISKDDRWLSVFIKKATVSLASQLLGFSGDKAESKNGNPKK